MRLIQGELQQFVTGLILNISAPVEVVHTEKGLFKFLAFEKPVKAT